MKKIKVMLIAIAVFAVIGGALAFKAKTYGSTIWSTSNQASGTLCPLLLQNFTVVGSGTFRCTTKAPDAAHPNGWPCVLWQTAPMP